jgi:tRNA threonylcarbamoyladenosine biosynthesis protein TsaB
MADGTGPRLVILETSGRAGQVALAAGETPVAARPLDEARRHARDLAPTLAALLQGQDWRPRDIDAVLVSRGPGSYTGLRVGIMSAKAFAYATGCALLATDTFAAVALQAPPDALLLDVIADAQQKKVYVQRFGRAATGARPEPLSPLSIQPLFAWLESLPPEVTVTGPGLRPYGERLPAGARTADAAAWDPRAESLLTLGLARYRAGERDDVWAVEPLYLRPSSAEEQWRHAGPTKAVSG